MNTITLYGSSLSLYTGRARSYLIKAGLAYQETTPVTEHYAKVVVPKAGNRRGIPTIELPNGEVIRDGAAIVDHFEAQSGYPFSPTTPKQRILSRLFDVIGAEGLLRPAMHYRWNFPEKNLEFLRFHFQSMMPRVPDRAAKADAAADRMRDAARSFGAVPDTFAFVESLYLELLTKLDAHFADQPYLLGGKSCIGDFGMIAPLFGHLGRDPEPLALMQANAIRLFRWVERMNRPDLDVGEFETQDGKYLADDDIPDTLIEVLKHIALDFVPETSAACDCINQWLDEQTDLAPGTEAARGVGIATFTVRDTTINAIAQPYRFYLLKRVQDEYAALNADDQRDVTALLSACNMEPLLQMTLSRELGRQNNLEVWL